MTSYFRLAFGSVLNGAKGVWGWAVDTAKTAASKTTEYTINIALNSIPYLKKGSKFTLKKDSDSVVTLENLELELDKTNESLKSLRLPFVATEAKLGQVGVKNAGSHWGAVVSELNLTLEIQSREGMPPPPPADKKSVPQQEPAQAVPSNSDTVYDDNDLDYGNAKSEVEKTNGGSNSTAELVNSITQFFRTLEIKFENINVKIRDPSSKSAMELNLGMVRFNGTASATESERVSAITIGRITLKSGMPEDSSSEPEEHVIFSFEPGKEDSIKLTQSIPGKNSSEENEEGVLDEIFSLSRLEKIDINFPGTKVCAKVGMDQVQTMKDLVLKFIDGLIEKNEEEREANESPSESFYGMVESNSDLHKSAFGKNIDLFNNNINHKEISDKSDFNVIFGEISLGILAKQNQDRRREDYLRFDLKNIMLRMESKTGLINASVESVTGDIVREGAEPLNIFRFTKDVREKKDVEVYLGTDTNMNFFKRPSPSLSPAKQTRGYLIKVVTTSQLGINFDPEILRILFENKILDLSPLAKKSEAGPSPPPTESGDAEEQKKPVSNSGTKLSISVDSTIKIRLNIPMNTALPWDDIEGREATVGYMFIHNLLKDYLWEKSCVFDIEASSLSFLSASTQGKINSSTMGIGFGALKVQLTRGREPPRTVFESRSKNDGMKQAYPILMTSNSGNGRHFNVVDPNLNEKTSKDFYYLEPDKIYDEYTRKRERAEPSFYSINPCDNYLKKDHGLSEEEEIANMVNTMYDFNNIFSDPYLIYGSIPKKEAETLNWNYYSAKCVNNKLACNDHLSVLVL